MNSKNFIPTNKKISCQKYVYIVCGERNMEGDHIKVANVGDTFDVSKRLKNQDYARKAAGGNWVVLHKWLIPQGARDYAVHDELEKIGYKKDPDCTGNTEEFKFNLSKEEVIKVVGNCIQRAFGVSGRKNSFLPRPEQIEAVNKASEAYNTGSKKFLFDCKMRFGKCLTSYWLMKKLDEQSTKSSFKTLILTYKCAVETSWKEDLSNHSDFHDYSFYDVDDGIQSETKQVYFKSFHALISDSKSLNQKRAWIYDIEWDLLVIDEEHYGTRSENAKEIRSKIRTSFALYLSGTPLQAKAFGEFSDHQTYTWTYEDEQTAKKEWNQNNAKETNPYLDLPKMNMFTIDIHPRIKELSKNSFCDDGESFTFKKLFSTKGKSLNFRNATDVENLFKLVSNNKHHFKGEMSPWREGLLKKDSHILLIVDGVNSAAALTKFLKQNQEWNIHFNVYNVAGDVFPSVNALKNSIAESQREGKGTITISCGRYTTGVTIKQWNQTWLMSDMRSITSYFQTIFRCQSPYRDHETKKILKDNCWVFDFSPYRCLEQVFNYKIAMDDSKGVNDVKSILSQWLDNCPMTEIDAQGSLRQIDPNRIINNLFKKPKHILEKMSDITIFNITAIDNKTYGIFSNVASCSPIKIMTLVNNELERGKNKKSLDKKLKITKEELNLKKSLEEKVKGFLQKIPNFLIISDNIMYSVNDVINTTEIELFNSITGVSIDDFSSLVSKGILNRFELDMRIRAIAILVSRLPKEIKPINALIELKNWIHAENTSTITPSFIVDDMVNSIPERVLRNPNSTYLDPSCGTGSFLLGLFKKLDKTLKHIIPDKDKRRVHIIKNQLFGFDNNSIQIKTSISFIKMLFKIVNISKPSYNLKCKDTLNKEEETMKFDVIIGNPPYNGVKSGDNKTHSLWKKFIKFAVNNSDITLFVTPDTTISNKGSVKLLTNNGGLHYYKFLGKKHFNVGVNTAHWIWEKNWNSDCSVELECGSVIKVNKSLLGRLPSSNISTISIIIQKKILGYHNKLIHKQSKIFHGNLNTEGLYKVLNTTAQGIVNSIKKPIDASDTKIMFSNTGAYKPFLDEGTCGTCWHSHSYVAETKEQALTKLNYFQSPMIKYFNKINREGGFTKILFAENIPDLENYTEAERYSILNFTKDEITEIERC